MEKQFEILKKELTSKRVPCHLKMSKEDFTIELGFNFPDSLANKVFDIIEKHNINACVCAEEIAPSYVKVVSICGGKKRYICGSKNK